MKTFKTYITEQKQLADLIEKQIIVGKGAKYGQIVFMAGGAGSGKGFAIKNFLEGDKFKIRDVDKWKKAFLELDKVKKKYPEIRGLNLNVPKDGLKLHTFIKKKRIKQKTLTALLSDVNQAHLPNILFDITLDNKYSMTQQIPSLIEAGFDPKNIHVIWVLTDWRVAIKQNLDPSRGRIVPEDILMSTHEGAANTMFDFIKNGTPKNVNGGVYIVLGGKKHTVLYTDSKGKPIKTGKNKDTLVVKDFSYLTMKEPGKKMTSNAGLQQQAFDWIKKNSPITLKNKTMNEK